LAAINTAHNHVSSQVSLARAAADQKIVQSHKAVEIETLNAQAEVQSLEKMAEQLQQIQSKNPEALRAYVRNVKLGILSKAKRVILQT
jgi:hypothetical protein